LNESLVRFPARAAFDQVLHVVQVFLFRNFADERRPSGSHFFLSIEPRVIWQGAHFADEARAQRILLRRYSDFERSVLSGHVCLLSRETG